MLYQGLTVSAQKWLSPLSYNSLVKTSHITPLNHHLQGNAISPDSSTKRKWLREQWSQQQNSLPLETYQRRESYKYKLYKSIKDWLVVSDMEEITNDVRKERWIRRSIFDSRYILISSLCPSMSLSFLFHPAWYLEKLIWKGKQNMPPQNMSTEFRTYAPKYVTLVYRLFWAVGN